MLDGDSYKMVYSGPIVLKELSDSSDSRLFRVCRGWFCPQLYRDCTWPKIWWFFWWFSRRDLALSPNDRWRFIKDHGEIHHPKKRSLVGHDLPGGYVTLDISPSDSWRLKKSILPKLPGKQRRWIGFGKCQAEAPETSTKALYVSWWRASQRYNGITVRCLQTSTRPDRFCWFSAANQFLKKMCEDEIFKAWFLKWLFYSKGPPPVNPTNHTSWMHGLTFGICIHVSNTDQGAQELHGGKMGHGKPVISVKPT